MDDTRRVRAIRIALWREELDWRDVGIRAGQRVRRVQAANDQKDLSENTMSEANSLNSPGLRRRQPSTKAVAPEAGAKTGGSDEDLILLI